MKNIQTIIHLLRDSDRPASHAKLMDDAADMLSRMDRMQKALEIIASSGVGQFNWSLTKAEELALSAIDNVKAVDDYCDAFKHFAEGIKKRKDGL